MMSHEFRTPLATTLMFLDLVLKMVTQPEAIQMITLSKNSLELLLNLISDIIDLKMIKEK